MKITNKGLYWGLIFTFALLYVLVAYVSTLHAIDFFKLSNNVGLAILLGVAYELGQASVLFSILMTKNKDTYLPWILMVLLTALQVTANVFASYKHMSLGKGDDWTYWYTSILKIFGVTGGNPETYQVIISWISGALLPVVALGMTALVAQNIKLITEEKSQDEPIEPVDAKDIIAEVSRVRPTDDDLKHAESILYKKTQIQKEEQEEETKIVNDNIHVEVSTVEEEPVVDVSNLIKGNVPEISNEDIDENEIKNSEIEAQIEEETRSLMSNFDPHVEEDEPHVEEETIKTLEPTSPNVETVVDPQVNVGDIIHNNGLIDVVPSPSPTEVLPSVEDLKLPPITSELPPDAKEIILDDVKVKDEEEKRLEHLREVARENLKKK